MNKANWKKLPTQKELREVYLYKPNTGQLIRKIKARHGNSNAGDIAGYCDKRTSYVNLKFKGKSYLAHRIIWSYVYGNADLDKDVEIDHINKIRNDNRISNLRLVSRTINLRNKKIYTKNKSGTAGVYSLNEKWTASIRVNTSGKSKNLHLGTYESLANAKEARQKAELKYWGLLKDLNPVV